MEDVDKKGCMLSSTRKSLTYVTNYGISLGENYPFQARRCLCEPLKNTPRLKLKNFTMVPTNSAEKIVIDLINCHSITGVIKMTEEFIELKNEIYTGTHPSMEATQCWWWVMESRMGKNFTGCKTPGSRIGELMDMVRSSKVSSIALPIQGLWS